MSYNLTTLSIPLLQAYQAEKSEFLINRFPLSVGYPLVNDEYLLLALCFYACLCMWGYHRMCSDSKPLFSDSKWLLRAYNSLQVGLSAVISYLAAITYTKKLVTQGFLCQPMIVDISTDPDGFQLEVFCCWLFYVSKWVDFMDTFFIISRSKWRQFSFLHVFHHSSIICFTWLATNYFPCGYFLVSVQLNAPVHVLMYSYYLLASFPSLGPYLWWKRYITSVQLAQFFAGNLVNVVCFYRQAAGYVSGLSLFFIATFFSYAMLLIILFSHFYRANYTSDARQQHKLKMG